MKNNNPTVTIQVISGGTLPPCGKSEKEEYTKKFLSPMEICSNSKVYIPSGLHATLQRLIKTVDIPESPYHHTSPQLFPNISEKMP